MYSHPHRQGKFHNFNIEKYIRYNIVRTVRKKSLLNQNKYRSTIHLPFFFFFFFSYFLFCCTTKIIPVSRSMKRFGVLPLLLDGMLVHRRLPDNISSGFPDIATVPINFILLGGERHCDSKVSCPRTQHSDQARTRIRTLRSEGHRVLPPNESKVYSVT